MLKLSQPAQPAKNMRSLSPRTTPELTKALNEALKKLKENGTIDELTAKWL